MWSNPPSLIGLIPSPSPSSKSERRWTKANVNAKEEAPREVTTHLLSGL